MDEGTAEELDELSAEDTEESSAALLEDITTELLAKLLGLLSVGLLAKLLEELSEELRAKLPMELRKELSIEVLEEKMRELLVRSVVVEVAELRIDELMKLKGEDPNEMPLEPSSVLWVGVALGLLFETRLEILIRVLIKESKESERGLLERLLDRLPGGGPDERLPKELLERQLLVENRSNKTSEPDKLLGLKDDAILSNKLLEVSKVNEVA